MIGQSNSHDAAFLITATQLVMQMHMMDFLPGIQSMSSVATFLNDRVLPSWDIPTPPSIEQRVRVPRHH